MTDALSTSLDSYEVLGPAGKGGRGQALKARYKGPDRPGLVTRQLVTLQPCPSEADGEEAAAARRGAELLRSFRHPGILQVVDLVRCEESSEVYPGPPRDVLVTEFVEGETLADLISGAAGGLPWEKAAVILGGLLDALTHLSAGGRPFCHRHLCPANVLVTRGSIPKLTGFEYAGEQGAESAGARKRRLQDRDYDYLAPEHGESALDGWIAGDCRSDIYSFGVCFYEAVTGKPPHAAGARNIGHSRDGYRRRVTDGPDAVSYNHPVFLVWPSMRRLVSGCLAAKPAQRFASFAEVREEFGKLRRRTLRLGERTYEYHEFLGKGGFGQVFRARDDTGRWVAIKEMIADRHAARFEREAKLLQRASHPHLVRYIDFSAADEEAMPGQRRLFLVLEYLEGMPGAGLVQRIKRSAGGLDPLEMLDLFAGYLDCLDHLNGLGIIHRDIKPANLYAPPGEPERAKIFDLGIAHDIDGTCTRGQIPGTLDYMPLEFAVQSADRGSAQSDIYSLAVTFYQALTRSLPFPRLPDGEAEGWLAFYQRALRPPACDFDFPVFRNEPALEALLRRALDVKPSQRPRSAGEMRDELRAIARRMRDRRACDRDVEVARAALERGDREEARRHLAAALSRCPKNPAAESLWQKLEPKADSGVSEAASASGTSRDIPVPPSTDPGPVSRRVRPVRKVSSGGPQPVSDSAEVASTAPSRRLLVLVAIMVVLWVSALAVYFTRVASGPGQFKGGPASVVTPEAVPVKPREGTVNDAVISTSSPAVSEAEAQFQGALQAARQAAARGDWSAAFGAAKAALLARPDDARAQQLVNEASGALSRQKEEAEATERYKAAMADAEAAFAQRYWEVARGRVEEALRHRPTAVDAQRLQARVLEAIEQQQTYDHALDKARGIQPGSK